MAIDKSFLGRGWAFPPHFKRVNREVVMSRDEEDIHQSLHILLSTHPGERIMNPQFGCDLRQYVHEEITQTLFTKMKVTIGAAIRDYEARISVNDIFFEYDNQSTGVIYVTIDYSIRQTNSRHNLVYPFYLLEGSRTA